ncbi:AAA family ATPase [Jannaschia sp. Os4]|uniref:AAA family ATPase n=1 Tax=Jannaschia sp. Os4 TaxID=2807617 RepID=UPI00193AA908|nr:AAA family ATPase [Jannaschia sp. Os4]MBM2576418.1 AAA family ATPase [Jannaschia sp. Os4]
MQIKFVEVANFRKLLSVRVDFDAKQTLFVGANNSGKSSAMLALRRFLVPNHCPFEIHDFTLCHWPGINRIGQSWLEANERGETVDLVLDRWVSFLPTLDLWLEVDAGEMHHVRDLIPTLDWNGGLLGVRLRYEPSDLEGLYKDFVETVTEAESLRAIASKKHDVAGNDLPPLKLTLWPTALNDYLARRLSRSFGIRAYILDPDGLQGVSDTGEVKPQPLPPTSQPLDGEPLRGLIKVHDIPAQRGFGGDGSHEDDEDMPVPTSARRLSDQLRSYYTKHLDPTRGPTEGDLGALQALETAQDQFDAQLTEAFTAAFDEVASMGYPGVADPRPKVSTRLRAVDGLNHASAVTFEVDVSAQGDGVAPVLRLPETNNGLGYQNLISMIFRLMGFRDAWMRVGKVALSEPTAVLEPLHLVLIEEPEAHLHAQVQQVFINKAYEVLRAHDDLGDNWRLHTQLIVSTHSSHVAHEVPFACLRYFRRLPAGMRAPIPVSAVVNLSSVFGDEAETARFVTRYLRAQHSDLFFADAAILVEGPAERMLMPNFIRMRYPDLSRAYVTLLEIGGSHAHRLRPLIEHLGLLTLVITDLDSQDGTSGKAAPPIPGAGQTTNNATLRQWVPEIDAIDDLLMIDAHRRVRAPDHDPLFAVRVAYQTPVAVVLPGDTVPTTAHPYTFEDALVFENLAIFAAMNGSGLVGRFRDAIEAGGTATQLGEASFDALRNGKKAEFALDVLDAIAFEHLEVPGYIAEGLVWLQERVRKKQIEVLPAQADAASDGHAGS